MLRVNGTLTFSIYSWRSDRDSNSGNAFDVYTLSRSFFFLIIDCRLDDYLFNSLLCKYCASISLVRHYKINKFHVYLTPLSIRIYLIYKRHISWVTSVTTVIVLNFKYLLRICMVDKG